MRLAFWLVGLPVVCLFSGCGDPPAAEEPIRPVRAMRVADFEAISGRQFPGQAEATQEVDLAFRVAGPLNELSVKVGDEVEAGDVIARIDPRDFEVALRSAEANLERAKATQQRAQSELTRYEDVISRNPSAISAQQMERAKEAVAISNADVVALEVTVNSATDALRDTQLKAPFAGTIVATYVENFENVRQKQMVVRLLDKTRVEFTTNVPESLISLVRYVDDIQVRFDAFPEIEIAAEVKEVGMEASRTTRTFPVTLIMDQPDGATILPGMAGTATGKVRPPSGDSEMDVVVPVTAVFAGDSKEQSFVWVINPSDKKVTRREVRVGNLVSGGYVIRSGLNTGEMIATAGVHFLKEGEVVQPQLGYDGGAK